MITLSVFILFYFPLPASSASTFKLLKCHWRAIINSSIAFWSLSYPLVGVEIGFCLSYLR